MARIFCGSLAALGGAVMILNLIRFHRMIRVTKRESYLKKPTNAVFEIVAYLFLCVFIFGYGVGTVDIFLRDVEPVYLFVASMFFLASLFLYALLNVLDHLLVSVKGKTLELMTSYVNSIEMKDRYTKGHSRHVARLVETFFRRLPHERAASLNLLKLLDAALLHDIGKMSVDDRILRKPGALDEEEWRLVKRHPVDGKKMLEGTCYEEIGDWVLHHHERVDGNGYLGVAGDAIPLEARIIAVADTYSALSTDSAYRKRLPPESIAAIMREAAGSQLDDEFVTVFLSVPAEELEAAADGAI